jgi:hypothetical protein
MFPSKNMPNAASLAGLPSGPSASPQPSSLPPRPEPGRSLLAAAAAAATAALPAVHLASRAVLRAVQVSSPRLSAAAATAGCSALPRVRASSCKGEPNTHYQCRAYAPPQRTLSTQDTQRGPHPDCTNTPFRLIATQDEGLAGDADQAEVAAAARRARQEALFAAAAALGQLQLQPADHAQGGAAAARQLPFCSFSAQPTPAPVAAAAKTNATAVTVAPVVQHEAPPKAAASSASSRAPLADITALVAAAAATMQPSPGVVFSCDGISVSTSASSSPGGVATTTSTGSDGERGATPLTPSIPSLGSTLLPGVREGDDEVHEAEAPGSGLSLLSSAASEASGGPIAVLWARCQRESAAGADGSCAEAVRAMLLGGAAKVAVREGQQEMGVRQLGFVTPLPTSAAAVPAALAGVAEGEPFVKDALLFGGESGGESAAEGSDKENTDPATGGSRRRDTYSPVAAQLLSAVAAVTASDASPYPSASADSGGVSGWAAQLSDSDGGGGSRGTDAGWPEAPKPRQLPSDYQVRA